MKEAQNLQTFFDLCESAAQPLDSPANTKKLIKLVGKFKKISREIRTNSLLQIINRSRSRELIILEMMNTQLMCGYDLNLHIAMNHLINGLELEILSLMN